MNLLRKIKPGKLWLFGAACTLVATGYIAYRGIAVLGPNGFGSFVKGESIIKNIGCSEGDEIMAAGSGSSTGRTVAASYQGFLADQTPMGKNIIANPALENINADTRTPAHYARTIENSTLLYQLRSDNNGQAYLHMEQAVTQNIGGAWVADSIVLQNETTYVYGFSYRSDTAALVTAELTSVTGESTYQPVATLEKSEDWRQFTYYFHNAGGSAGFRFIVSPNAAGSLDTRNFSIHQIADARLRDGLVSVTFDDGWQSAADKALPLLNRYNLKTTQYIISDAARDKVPGYMTYPTIAAMKHRGDEIGSHSLAHCDQTRLPEQEVRANARQSKGELEKQKLGPVSSFAYPYGSYNDTTQHVIAEEYELVRTSDEGYNDRYFNRQNIRSFAITNHTTDQEFQAWLDYARNHKVWLVLVYHRVDEKGEYSVSSASLQRQLQMIHDSKLRVLPLAAAARDIRR